MVQCILEGEYSERQAEHSAKGGKNILENPVLAKEQREGISLLLEGKVGHYCPSALPLCPYLPLNLYFSLPMVGAELERYLSGNVTIYIISSRARSL